MVVAAWDQAGTMRARWLPKVWRDGRALYRLTYPPGWWVDITSTRTLAALSAVLDSELHDLGVSGGLTSPDATALTGVIPIPELSAA